MKNLFMKKENEKDNEYKNVRDHCHYTGKYRSAAHRIPKEIPVVFHKGSKYDHH